MTQSGRFHRLITSLSHGIESLSKALLWSAKTQAGVREVPWDVQALAALRHGEAMSPRTLLHKGGGLGGGPCGEEDRCRMALEMLGPQEPPRMADW